MREGIWRTRCGQRVVVTRCESDDGRQWTDGADYYSYDGSIWGDERARSRHDLVEYIGMYPPPKPPSDKTFEIERLQRELQQAEMERIAEANANSQSEALRVEQAAEIERLQAELQQAEIWRTAATERNRQSLSQLEERDQTIERLQAELKAERADTHRRLTTAHNNHNLHVAGLKAEHRGESAGLQTAIRLILEKLDA